VSGPIGAGIFETRRERDRVPMGVRLTGGALVECVLLLSVCSLLVPMMNHGLQALLSQGVWLDRMDRDRDADIMAIYQAVREQAPTEMGQIKLCRSAGVGLIYACMDESL